MSYDDLTPFNFVARIKEMDKAERGRIATKKFIELIVQLPDSDRETDLKMSNLELVVQGFKGTLDHVLATANRNKEDIAALNAHNTRLTRENDELRGTVRELTTRLTENENVVKADNDCRRKINELQSQIHEIEQYLRVNNLEIVGLPAPDVEHGETDESVIVDALNSLVDLPNPIHAEDIDISHPLKSQRRDNKPVHVVRFISRKVKYAVLAAKKAEANRQFKFRNSDVFINEHLNKNNRSLFAAAQERKRALQYKYVWTKNGVVHMRKRDDSEIIVINSLEDIQGLE